MKFLLTATLLTILAAPADSEDFREESRYLGFLSGLQFVETPEDLKKLIPECPPPTADAGGENSEIVVKTTLFGCEAKGEFNFHQGILVSHGFEVLTKSYEEAHQTFLKALALLNEQSTDLEVSTTLPIALNGEDPSDGPEDEINLLVDGSAKNASFQLRLEMRRESVLVRWGAQKLSEEDDGQ